MTFKVSSWDRPLGIDLVEKAECEECGGGGKVQVYSSLEEVPEGVVESQLRYHNLWGASEAEKAAKALLIRQTLFLDTIAECECVIRNRAESYFGDPLIAHARLPEEPVYTPHTAVRGLRPPANFAFLEASREEIIPHITSIILNTKPVDWCYISIISQDTLRALYRDNMRMNDPEVLGLARTVAKADKLFIFLDRSGFSQMPQILMEALNARQNKTRDGHLTWIISPVRWGQAHPCYSKDAESRLQIYLRMTWPSVVAETLIKPASTEGGPAPKRGPSKVMKPEEEGYDGMRIIKGDVLYVPEATCTSASATYMELTSPFWVGSKKFKRGMVESNVKNASTSSWDVGVTGDFAMWWPYARDWGKVATKDVMGGTPK